MTAQLRVRTVSGFSSISPDQRNVNWISKPNNNKPNSIDLSCCSCLRFSIESKRCRRRRRPPSPPRQSNWAVFISCKSSSPGSSSSSNGGDQQFDGDDHDEFFESSLLVSETFWHYRSVKQGFREDMKRHPSNQLPPFSVQATGTRPDLSLIGQGFLRRFPNPTIFLKISCDGDFLLPIVVGEFAIEKLVDASQGDNSEGGPDQYQFVSNIAEDLGYEVKMVQITRRVVNTYFAKLCISKAGENEIISVDMRPSDAINVAYRCKAPIYVSKQVVLADAIRISYGMGRPHIRKSTYDVTLDSAADGPDLLSEELLLVKNMNLAAHEEKYDDAAMWRDKLTRLRESQHDC